MSMSRSPGDLMVLFLLPTGRAAAYEAESVSDDGAVRIQLRPVSPVDSGAIKLLGEATGAIGVAYSYYAFLGSLKTSSSKIDANGEETWTLAFERNPRLNNPEFHTDMAFGSYSADELARLRARRILLNEKLPGIGDQANDAMFEVFVRGMGTPVRATESPLPALYKDYGADPQRFARLASLFCVFLLILTKTVRTIDQLTIQAPVDRSCRVMFKGTRHRPYSNQPPTEIEVNGICRLES